MVFPWKFTEKLGLRWNFDSFIPISITSKAKASEFYEFFIKLVGFDRSYFVELRKIKCMREIFLNLELKRPIHICHEEEEDQSLKQNHRR